MSKYSRAFSSLGRSVLRSHLGSSSHDGTIRIQRVRFKKPPLFSWHTGKKIGTIICGAIAFEAITSYHEYKEWIRTGQGEPQFAQDFKGLFREGQSKRESAEVQGIEQQEEESEEEEDEDSIVPDEPPEDAIFIPMGLVRQCEQTFYKAEDPEWKSFVEFAVNKQRNQQVRRELAGLVGMTVNRGQPMTKLLGKNIKVGKYWIDVDYPEGPPPEYERGGIEITDDYVAWVVRPVPAHNYSRLLRALWPEPIAQSFWSSFNLLWTLQLARIKDFLNIKPDGEEAAHEPPNKTSAVGLPPANRESAGTSPSPVSALPLPANAQPQQDAPSSMITDLIKNDRRLRSPLPEADMGFALKTFKQTLRRKWKPLAIPAPRGTIFFSGLVEVSGSRALCVLDVRAVYHPVEARWVAINIGVRRTQMRKQRARGDA